MSPSFKGLISIIISIVFFFPWAWMGIFHIKLSATPVILIGIVVAGIAIFLGFQARKGGSRFWGTAGMTLAIISMILNVVNLIAINTR